MAKQFVLLASWLMAAAGMVLTIHYVFAGIKRALVELGYYVGAVGTLYAASIVFPVSATVAQALPVALTEYASICGLMTSCTLVIKKAYR